MIQETETQHRSSETPLRKLFHEFLFYLEIERGRSLKTVENYSRYVSSYLEQSKAKNPEDITDDSVRSFRLWLNREVVQGGRNRKKKTQNYYLIGLRVFLKYLARRGVSSLPPDRIELAKTGDRDLDLISLDEFTRLRNSPDVSTVSGKRDKAIIEVLFSTGLRVSELSRLNRYDSFDSGELSVRGKGEKVRLVFVSPEALQTIKSYVEARTDMDEALFIRDPGRSKGVDSLRLTSRSIQNIISFHAKKAGISKKLLPMFLGILLLLIY